MHKHLFPTLAILVTSCMPAWPLSAAPQGPKDAANPPWREAIPRIEYPDKGLVDLYEKTWEIAAGRVRKGPEGLPASPYLDENCYEDQIWIWDSCFMVMFSKYAPDAYPGKETLSNLYVPIHENTKTPLLIHLRDNPPLFAWIEYDNFIFNGDLKRLEQVARDKRYLQKHYDFFAKVPKGSRQPGVSPQGIHRDVILDGHGNLRGFTWTGGASGMDNTPRGRDAGGYDKILWIDAIAQQALSALYIQRICEKLGDKEEARKWKAEYQKLKDLINEKYWDEKDGFYYDIAVQDGAPCRIKTPASFWVLMAEVAPKERAARMIEALKDPQGLGGEYPWASLERRDPQYNAETGDYWRGGVWMPMAYMGAKALEKYGYHELADELARRNVLQILRTYQTFRPQTIWECYSPSRNTPSTEHGRTARPDFCGWSALGPISLMIENVMGFRQVDAINRRVTWSIKAANGTHGIRNLRFGGIVTDIRYDPDSGKVSTKSNASYTLDINGRAFRIEPGMREFPVEAR